MFEVEYLETAESRKMKSTPIESYSIGLTFDTPIDVAFSPRLNSTKLIHYILEKKKNNVDQQECP